MPLLIDRDVLMGRTRNTGIDMKKIGATGRDMNGEMVRVRTGGARKHPEGSCKQSGGQTHNK